ncbi:hypothetical protein GCM10028819_09500 [Spirosoma humi]
MTSISVNIFMEDFTSERRRLVWLALSDLYADNELQASDLAYIRRVFVQSDYSQAEIKRINYHEVAPVLLNNLWRVAGVWQGYDKEWVIDQITDRLNRPRANQSWGLIWWLWCRQVDYYTKPYFDVIFG